MSLSFNSCLPSHITAQAVQVSLNRRSFKYHEMKTLCSLSAAHHILFVLFIFPLACSALVGVGASVGELGMQQQPGCCDNGCGGSCWYSGVAAGKQAAPRQGSAGAAIFTPPAAFFRPSK